MRFRIEYSTHAELAASVKQMAHGGVLVRDPAAQRLAFDTPVVLELVMPDGTTMVSGGRVLQALAGLGVAVTIEPHVIEQARGLVQSSAGASGATTATPTQASSPPARTLTEPSGSGRAPMTTTRAPATSTPARGIVEVTRPSAITGSHDREASPRAPSRASSTPAIHATSSSPTNTTPRAPSTPARDTPAFSRTVTTAGPLVPPRAPASTTPAQGTDVVRAPASITPAQSTDVVRAPASIPLAHTDAARAETADAREGEEPSSGEDEPARESKSREASEPTRAQKIQLALHGTRDQRNAMLRDRDRGLHAFVLKNAGITADDVLAIAKNPQMGPEIYKQISERADWLQRPQIALALARNPKVPGEIALRALAHVAPDALRLLAKGAGAPLHVVQAARKRVIGGK